MEKLMTDPEVMVDSEMDTIEVLSSWVQFNVLEREPMVGRLLRNINFEAISPTKIATLQVSLTGLLITEYLFFFFCGWVLFLLKWVLIFSVDIEIRNLPSQYFS